MHLGSQIEVDIAALDRERELVSSAVHPAADEGGAATAVWAPAEPSLAVETDLADADEYEVRVYDAARGRRLVAAVELAAAGYPSPSDRLPTRPYRGGNESPPG